MTSFTNVFGGSAVSPSEVAFAQYSFSTNLTLYWPAFSAGQTDVAARFMNLTATNNSLNVSMPDATLVSVGYDVIIFNAGADTFSVVDFNGGAIATIAAGQTYYLLLKDNTTQAGAWQTVQFGVGTGSASAAALAGAGLLAAAGLLNVNFDATTVGGSTTITSAARAILQVWVGGAGTLTLPTAASVGDGFFFPLANNGSGSVTVATSGGDQIDGASTSVFSQTQSAFVVSSGSAWYTVGKGIQNTFSVTLLNLNVAGSADVTETSAQAQNIIQQYTGVLTGNINVIVPATVQLYYVFNNTSGAFTLTVKTASGTGIAVDQGSHSILYCDGTNVVNAFTSTFGGAISIAAGSATSPNLNIIGSVTTGLYSPASNQLAVTANGKEVMNFTSAASAVNFLQSTASATGTAVSISALGSDTNIDVTFSPKGSGSINIAKVNIDGGTIDGTVIGGASAAAITGTTITGSSIVGPLTGNATTATALQTARNINGVAFNGTADITVTAAAGTLTGSTLNSGVTSSSLTSVGTLVTGVWNATTIAVAHGGTGATSAGATAAGNIGALAVANNLSDVASASAALSNIFPSGIVVPFAGSSAPTGWTLCFGQAVSRSTFSTLFSAIGTTYGIGDGSTTFNLPDLRGRLIAGVDSMGGSAANLITNAVCGIAGTTLGAAGGNQALHGHTHTASVTDPGHVHSIIYGGDGAATGTLQRTTNNFGTVNTNSATTGITVSNTSTGAGSSQNVQPTMMLNYIIKN